jgi:hypothetical protein
MLKAWPIAFVSIAAIFLAGVTGVNAGTTQSGKSTSVVSPTPAAEKPERERKLAAATEVVPSEGHNSTVMRRWPYPHT